jgi:SAM-dependent methyltransferase
MSGPVTATAPVPGQTCETAANPLACRVCRWFELRPFMVLDGKDYWRCETCEAILLDKACLPSRDEEYVHYLKHENDPDDPRYRRFLSKLAVPLLNRLPESQTGLDYGCGPGPGLAAMLREAGHEVRTYDPFFAADPAALEGIYDFIICSEVAEHFHWPAEEFDRLAALLRPGGWLAVMTCFQTDDARFAEWHYRRDPTHVVFYREATFRHLAGRLGWSCDVPAKDVVLMRKPEVR